MALITSERFNLVPDTSGIAQQIGNALQQRAKIEREDQFIAKAEAKEQQKQQAIAIQKTAKTAGAQALRLSNIPDFKTQRRELGILIENAIGRGENPKDLLSLMNVDNQDELNLGFARVATAAGNADKLLEQGLATVKAAQLPSEQIAFESLTSGLSEEQKKEAKLIKLGLSPRAVGSAVQTITDKGIAEEIGDTEAIIAQRKKFGDLTGSSRAKAIDKGFDRVTKIDKGITNIDRAIAVLEGGASTGAVKRFLPSFRAATIELKQIQNEMALDVIGGVTLGAISEAELDLVKLVALPDGLTPVKLIEHLQDRKAAQQKIKAYFLEQIQFIDKGGTVAGFLRAKENELESGSVNQPATQTTIKFNRQGQRI